MTAAVTVADKREEAATVEGLVAIAACVAATAEAARAEALKVGGDVGGRVGGVDGAPVSAPVWLAVNMAAWRSARQPRKGHQQTSSEIFRTAVREEKLRACTNYNAFDRLAAHESRWLQQ